MEPSRSERRVICEANDLVAAIATWIGHCTVFANSFPIDVDGKRCFIRDSSAVRSDRLRVQRKRVGPELAIKRKWQLGDTFSSVALVPISSPQPASFPEPALSTTRRVWTDGGARPKKRARVTEKKADEVNDATFMEYWAEQRRLATPFIQPAVTAADRRKAMVERIAAKSVGGGG